MSKQTPVQQSSSDELNSSTAKSIPAAGFVLPNAGFVLQGGHVVDPANQVDGIADVVVDANGQISAVGNGATAPDGAQVFDMQGKLVVPGLIDTHAHVYHQVTGKFGLVPDWVGVRSGATTLVDQGGPSCMTIGGFRNFICDPAQSRVLCFISTYLVGGLEGHLYPELYGPNGVNVKHTLKAIEQNRDIVKGIKAHAEIGGASRWGLEVIRMAKEISHGAQLPVYIHLGQLWPTKENAEIDADELVRDLVPMLDEGDVLAHPFTRHPGGFISGETGELHPVIREALDRGVQVDVGHGSHFSFDMARRAIDAGIIPTTLGADLHGYNVRIPDSAGKTMSDEERAQNPFAGVAPFSLTIAMSELLTLGMSLSDVIATATSNAARLLKMEDCLGDLSPGKRADISILEQLDGEFVLKDNSGDKVVTRQYINPVECFVEGVRHKADSPLVPPPVAAS